MMPVLSKAQLESSIHAEAYHPDLCLQGDVILSLFDVASCAPAGIFLLYISARVAKALHYSEYLRLHNFFSSVIDERDDGLLRSRSSVCANLAE